MKRNQKGFTLIELTIVIAIIAILAAVSMKGYGWVQSSKASACADQLRTMRTAALNWKAANGATNYTGVSLAVLQAMNLLQAADSNNKFGGATSVAAGTPATSVVLTSAIADATYGPIVTANANSFFGAGICAYAAGTITCTFAND